jgi:hypothetical protein
MQLAFDEMGGVDALADWGKRNPEMFYALYARLATTEPAFWVLEELQQQRAIEQQP